MIVGATGVLRPAVLTCVARGWTVLALARDRGRLADLVAEAQGDVRPVAVDVYDEVAMKSVLAAASWSVDDAILYLAATDDAQENAAVERISSTVPGTTVRILTSRWTPAELCDPRTRRWPSARGRLHLLLGVAVEAGGGRRWHTPEEISGAALDVLTSGRDSILGMPAS